MDLYDRYLESRKLTLFGALKNAFLALIKITFGITGHSHALFADGIHSLADLLIDSLVLIAARFGSKAADKAHPYGHGRIETIATTALALLLALIALGIIYNGILEILGKHASVTPDFYVLIVALFSVLLNEILYFYTKRTGTRIESNLLIANAWHHRSDSLSSVVVLFGASLAWFGFKHWDAIGAVVVGLMILKMAWDFGKNSVKELIDTGLDEQQLALLQKEIIRVPGVQALHQLRTRSVGGQIFLDVHILVDPNISVSEGHYIGHCVHTHLMRILPGIRDVIVHVDPEDDEIFSPSDKLPNRATLIQLLKPRWQHYLPESALKNMTLHYLRGKIEIELKLDMDFAKKNILEQELKDALRDLPDIVKIRVFYC